MAIGRHRADLLSGHEEILARVERVVDVALIALTHAAAAWAYNAPWHTTMTTATAIAAIVYLLAAEIGGLYRPFRSQTQLREIWDIGSTWLSVPAALVFLGFITKTTEDHSRVVTLAWFITAPLMLASTRLLGRAALIKARSAGTNHRRTAIIGATANGAELCRMIEDQPWLGLRLAGIYDDRGPSRRSDPAGKALEVVGGIERLIEDARAGRLDVVYIALPLRAEARIARILRELADTTATVFLAADFFTYDLLHARWTQLGGMPLLSIYDSPFRGPAGWLKRLEDVVLGSLILALIAIPMGIIAVAVKVTSPGPVLFRQRRYGLNGKEIMVLKFRTMSVWEDGPTIKQATTADPRVTPIGRFLRRNSLDELPQFFQVLTGEMSIVGPRPHAVAHNEQYRALIHGYMLRHKVKPGVTGWAQVNGWRGETGELEKMAKRIQHDLEYIQNWNLWWDIKIIILTVFGSKKSQNAV